MKIFQRGRTKLYFVFVAQFGAAEKNKNGAKC